MRKSLLCYILFFILVSCTDHPYHYYGELIEDTLMVRFRDYRFFVPKQGVEGKIAIVKGSAFMDTIAVEMLRHYAEDAGESKEKILLITEPKYVLSFIADGVLIKK